ncbi:alpha/beta fold hydrolase [Dactylosporangium sp. CA-092794]|uniref:alpha/beta fold hydrolase n=1 Tax=Dactylosporangium sp. CA-092794 TaxID=3239929 RepID=UPI003D911142
MISDTVAVNGTRTSYRRHGRGPALVLVHGLQVGQELFDNLVGHLAGDWTVITYDQRDRGGTTNPAEPYTVDDLADDLAALLGALGLSRAHVLGTSYGGMVAQTFALRHPALLDRLVLAATGRHPLAPGRLPDEAGALLTGVAGGDPETARRLADRFAAPAAARSASIAAVTSGAHAADPAALARRFAAVAGFDTRGRLAAVEAETLVLHGRADPVVQAGDSLAMALELPRGTLLLLDGVGHTWENEAPARAAALIGAYLSAAR